MNYIQPGQAHNILKKQGTKKNQLKQAMTDEEREERQNEKLLEIWRERLPTLHFYLHRTDTLCSQIYLDTLVQKCQQTGAEVSLELNDEVTHIIVFSALPQSLLSKSDWIFNADCQWMDTNLDPFSIKCEIAEECQQFETKLWPALKPRLAKDELTSIDNVLKEEGISILNAPYSNIPRSITLKRFAFNSRYVIVQDVSGLYRPVGHKEFLDAGPGSTTLWPIIHYQSQVGRCAIESWQYMPEYDKKSNFKTPGMAFYHRAGYCENCSAKYDSYIECVDDEDMFGNIDTLIYKLQRPEINSPDSDDDEESHRYFSTAEQYVEPLFTDENRLDGNWGLDLTKRALGRSAVEEREMVATLFGMILENLPEFVVDEEMGISVFADVLAKAVKDSAKAIEGKLPEHQRALGGDDASVVMEEASIVMEEESVVVEDESIVAEDEEVDIENVTPVPSRRRVMSNLYTPQKDGPNTPRTSAFSGTNFGSFAARGAGSLRRGEDAGVPSTVNPKEDGLFSSASSLSLHDEEEEDEMLGDAPVVIADAEEEAVDEEEEEVLYNRENRDPTRRASVKKTSYKEEDDESIVEVEEEEDNVIIEEDSDPDDENADENFGKKKSPSRRTVNGHPPRKRTRPSVVLGARPRKVSRR